MAMIQTFSNMRNALRVVAIRNKLLFTLFILVIYQFVAHVPVIGVDREALQLLLDSDAGSGLISVLNLLSGGAVANFSVIANGVYPYITASIIFQLLIPVIPQLEQIQREPGGQEKIQRWTYYASIPMAIMQSVAQINIFNILASPTGAPIQIIPGFGQDPMLTLTVIVTMTAGCMFAIWLGELITEEGIGNGISIIIFAGIVAVAPQQFINLMINSTGAFRFYNILLFVVLILGSVIACILVQEGVRRVPVQYGKKVRGRKQYGGASTYIPLKVNPVGMIPLIFAQSVMAFPAILASLLPESEFATNLTLTFGSQTGFVYWFTFFLFTVGFTFFYSDVMTQNQNLADNLQRQNGFIPGIRPGKRTEDYIQRVTRRITLVGAVFLGLIAIIPGLTGALNNLLFATGTSQQTNAAFVIGGAGLIIVVGVVIDTLRQLEAQLVMRNYEGFMR
jgi:preprotein translocase subunit SecY